MLLWVAIRRSSRLAWLVMAMKRKLKWLAIVLAVSLLGLGTALFLWPRDRITAESWKQIQIGMSEKEVEEILRGPGMSYEEHLVEDVRLLRELGRTPFEIEEPSLEEPGVAVVRLPRASERYRIWSGRRGRIDIQFDQENRVCWKQFQGVRWINRGILERLRDWLGW
jgi:hypothetical protein